MFAIFSTFFINFLFFYFFFSFIFLFFREQPELTDGIILSNLLTNYCFTLPNDYWNVEWCHRKEIKQFHYELNPVDSNHYRAPDYSLGVYKKSVVVKERGEYMNTSARIVKVCF